MQLDEGNSCKTPVEPATLSAQEVLHTDWSGAGGQGSLEHPHLPHLLPLALMVPQKYGALTRVLQ